METAENEAVSPRRCGNARAESKTFDQVVNEALRRDAAGAAADASTAHDSAPARDETDIGEPHDGEHFVAARR